ncbi:MAG: NTP transferase domain-containing protein [Spirochaetaceae bacterium]|jgi:spore coat polysaccharide biosynthesis protein SpsF|nr:NTP transferase domain-containing protein [Spirochaetaceae bacterium]
MGKKAVTGVVLQARLDSSRLPGKALLPLDGEPLLLRVMEALKTVPADRHILACPEDSRGAFAPLSDRAGFALLCGSKEDVLSRYCAAIRAFGLERVIRATGDNPFVFSDAADALNREAGGADYAAYAGLPHGAGVEAVRADALLRAEAEAPSGAAREHVCPYLYGNPDRFLLHRPLAPRPWRGPRLRITVDTRADYERAAMLYEEITEITEITETTEPGARYRGEAIIAAYYRRFGPEGR